MERAFRCTEVNGLPMRALAISLIFSRRLTLDRTQPNLAEDLPEHAGPSNADPSGSSRRSGRRSGLRFSNVARQPTRHSAMGVSFATTLM